MDANWRPTQGAESTMDTSDWRSQLQPDSRQRIVNKIMDTLMRHLPISGQDGLHELRKIAQRFEEKIYAAATSQSDYLRKISLKMLTMENKTQNTMVNAMQSNAGGPSNKPIDSGIPMQSQVHNPGQSHAIPVPNQSQSCQQLLSQNVQNNSAPPVSNIDQTPLQNVVGPNSDMQNNMFGGSQRQMPPRQQVVPQQQQQSQNSQPYLYQQQQQSQNSQPYLYQQQQLLQQYLKRKIPPGNIQHSLIQPHFQMQQQQPKLQPNQLQSSQSSVMQTSSVMQPSIMQTSLASLQQNQQANNVQQSTQPMLQQHSQSVIRQQQQQTSINHQQQTPISQQPIMPSQQQQQQLLAPQSNVTSMQQMFQNQHSSPQVDSQNLPLLGKVSASMQSANPPFVGATPLPPLAPSPVPGDLKKPISVVSSLSNAANIGHQQKVIATVPAKSLAIVTPGIISASSPLLAKFSGPNGAHGNALAISSAKLTVALLFFLVLWLVFYCC